MNPKYLNVIAALASMAALAEEAKFSGENNQGREVPRNDSNRKKIYETSKQGQRVFTFVDGFSCKALNQKNADRKHAAFLKKH